MSNRAVLVRWHRRIALGIGLLLLVQLLTGIALVFRMPLVASGVSGHDGPRRSFSELRQHVQAAYPQARFLRTDFPSDELPGFLFHLQDASQTRLLVFVDAAGTQVRRLGWVAGAVDFLHGLHEDLHLGKPGRIVIAIEAAALLALVITGWIVWWPGIARAVKSLRLPARGPLQGRLYHWHRTTGVVAGLLLVPGIVSGFVLAIGAFLPPWTPNVLPPATVAMTDEARLQLATGLFPGLTVRDVRYDRATGSLSRIVLYDGTAGLRAPISDVTFDPAAGTVRDVIDRHRLSGTDRLRGWAFPVHSAQWGGMAMRLLLLVTGIGAVALALFGISLWWLRRTAIRARSLVMQA